MPSECSLFPGDFARIAAASGQSGRPVVPFRRQIAHRDVPAKPLSTEYAPGVFLRRLISRAALLLITNPVLAGVNQWTPLGPNGPAGPLRVDALAVAADAIYAASGPEIFRSTDHGLQWTSVFHASSDQVFTLATGSQGVVYSGTGDGVFRSRNGGTTWFGAGLGGQTVFALAVDPRDPSIVYAGTDSGTSVGGLFQTKDGGGTWDRVAVFPGGSISRVAIDPSNPDTVFAGGVGGGGILRTRDGGSHWDHLGGTDVTLDLAVDPADSNRVYAIRLPPCSGPVFCLMRLDRSTDGGDTWVSVPLPALPAYRIVVDATSTLFVNAGVRVYASRDFGETWAPIENQTRVFASVLAFDPLEPATLYAATSEGVLSITIGPPGPCASPGTTLCLQDGRFQVTVGWQASPLGPTFPASAVPVTSKSGYFWFFDPDNVEVMVKILDGTSINGHFWVFYGALSNVQYTVHVTDTLSGETKDYVNPQGTLASVADTQAFPSADGDAATAATASKVAGTSAGSGPLDPCQPDGATLCLNDGRFRVVAAFQLTPSGPTFEAQAVPLTGDTGYFWFFDEANVELVLKVLDGRAVNGHFWVFYGALSSVEYTITVTDTQTGDVKTYHNDRGKLASVADTSAF